MPGNLEHVLAKLPAKRRAKMQQRAAELATLKDLRHTVELTQEELASALGVGEDTISRLEQPGRDGWRVPRAEKHWHR